MSFDANGNPIPPTQQPPTAIVPEVPGAPQQQPAAPPPIAAQPPIVRSAPAQQPVVVEEPDDNDDEARPVRGRGGVMNDDAISERMKRERRKWLREEYGTTDEAEIQRIKEARRATEEENQKARDRLKTYEQADEEKKRAEMSEVERLTVDLNTANAKIAELEGTIRDMKTNELRMKQDANISALAQKLRLVPEGVEALQVALARHYESLTRDQKRLFTPTTLERWATKWAKERPRFVQVDEVPATTNAEAVEAAEAGKPAKPATPPVRRLIGGPPRQQPAARPAPSNRTATNPQGKTVMQMSKKELDAYAKSKGLPKGVGY